MRMIVRYFHFIYIAIVLVVVVIMPLSRRQFRGVMSAVDMAQEPLLAEGEYIISPYDNIFRRVCSRHHLDWTLMSAIASCESRFDPNARSERGAVGLMQVMPHIARHWDVAADELLDVAINIDVSCRIYRSTRRQLMLPRDIDPMDAVAFTIAAYNCGASRVTDARNLAEYYDDDKNEWDVVSEYLLLLSDPDFYEHEAVVGGKFGEPHITIAYTNRVLKRYENFSKRVN